MSLIRQCDKCGMKMLDTFWEYEQARVGGTCYDLCKDCAESVTHFIIGVKE